MIQTRSHEEIANTITHALGVILVAIGTPILLKHTDSNSLFPCIIFCLGLFCLYLASTLYHWTIPGKLKRIFRHFDHINIYVLIAASYTPIWLIIIGGTFGWIAFGIMWAIAIAGAIGKIIALGKYPKLSLSIYLILGWSVVVVAKQVWLSLSTTALWWLLLEAISYTVGTYFYANDEKHPYFHAIWHIFVLLGSIAHFMIIYLIIQQHM